MERLKDGELAGWTSGIGGEELATLDSKVCTKGAGLRRAGTGTRQTSQAWLPNLHQSISPEVLPTPILTLTPSPAVQREYSWHRWTTYPAVLRLEESLPGGRVSQG